jgi:hypothetical protein
MAGLLFMSFSSLDASEYGLDYNSITKTIDPKYYGSGIYFLGFGHSFLRYPSVQTNLEFSNEAGSNRPALDSRTSDGLQVTFQKVTVTYRLRPESLIDLYLRYGSDYQTPCSMQLVDNLNALVTNFTAR